MIKNKLKNTVMLGVVLTSNFAPTASSIYNFSAAEVSACDSIHASEGTNANCNQNLVELENGSFEDLLVSIPTSTGYIQTTANNVPGWNTTATDNKIEVWTAKAYNTYVSGGDTSGFVGLNMVELNATQDSSLYQDFETEPGQTIKVHFKHGGRQTTEHAALMIGEPRDFDGGDKYPTEGHDEDIVVESSVAAGEWEEYTVTYVVPEGQTTTRIAFTSLDSGSSGNFIEDVVVAVDSIYDTDIEIVPSQSTNSYKDNYTVFTRLEYIYGDSLGEFIADIDIQNLKNIDNVQAFDSYGNEVDIEYDLDYYIDENRGHLYIHGGAMEEGYIVFTGDSALEEDGDLTVSSKVHYTSSFNLATGGDLLSSYTNGTSYWVHDIDAFATTNNGPIIQTLDDVYVYEGDEYTQEQLLEMSNATAYDLEDEETKAPSFSGDDVDLTTAGTFNETATFVDSIDEITNYDFTVNVLDVLPEISTEYDEYTVELGSDPLVNLAGIFNPSASDANGTVDLTSEITIDSASVNAINYDVTGSYPVYFMATDDEGNTVTTTVYINVVYDKPDDLYVDRPVVETTLTLDTNTEVVQDEEVSYTDEELLDMFVNESNADYFASLFTLSIEHDIDFSTPGDYDVTITLTENATGVSTSTDAVYTVVDVLPVMTNDDEVYVLKGASIDYKDALNVVSSEITDGDLTDAVVIDDSLVNLSEVGSYTVSFTTSDEEGNTFTNDATVNVVLDTFTITEDNELSTDDIINKYIPSTTNVVDASYNINFTTPGNYDIVFTITDIDGDVNTITSTLIIEDVVPTILADDIASSRLYKELDDSELVELFNVVATEHSTNDIFDSITVDSSAVNFDAAGNYPIVFTANDNDGNFVTYNSTLIIEGLIGVDNGQDLDITINGLEDVTIEENLNFSDEELIELFDIRTNNAYVKNDREITVNQANVDYSTPGSYKVTFTNTDLVTGDVVKFTGTLHITDVLPEISSKKDIVISTNVKSIDNYIELFEVTTNNNGDIVNSVAVNAKNVEFGVPGKYTVYFSITDNEGNKVTTSSNLFIIDTNTAVNELLVADEELTINLGDNIEDFIRDYNVSSSIGKFDVTEYVTVDYSNVDFNKTGTYDVIFTLVINGKVIDYQVSKLHIVADESTDSNTDDVTVDENDEDTSSEDTVEDNSKSNNDTEVEAENDIKILAETGASNLLWIVSITSLVALLSVKFSFKK